MKDNLWKGVLVVLFVMGSQSLFAQKQSKYISEARQLVGEPDGVGDLSDSVAQSFIDQFLREAPNWNVLERDTFYLGAVNQDSFALPVDFYSEMSISLSHVPNKKFTIQSVDKELATYTFLTNEKIFNQYNRLDTIVSVASSFNVLLRKDVIKVRGVWRKLSGAAQALVPVAQDSIMKAATQTAGASYYVFKGQPDPSLTFLKPPLSAESLFCFVDAVYPKYFIEQNRDTADTGAGVRQRYSALKLFPPLTFTDTVRVHYSALLDTVPDNITMTPRSLQILDEPVRGAVIPYMANKYFLRKQMVQQAEIFEKQFTRQIGGWLGARRLVGKPPPQAQ